ncbi:HNH endonuclease [Flavobacterium cutihirudinis]|uniref:HNH endonuclease n=1 Tax=Flavobacterium cutihirudinis TaxID=1265740 RepID=A0A3D9G164_9FLAO|nr:HNH endonuclease [Flavobacterium cutihirudinis]RED26940.1 HNH endonuclease [Flavobacterium cutihirudinis]
MTTKEEFTKYLTSTEKYAPSTIYTYGQSIELISQDISNNLEIGFKSLFNITDVNILQDYFHRLYLIPAVMEMEETQRKRKNNAFKRYIEFCGTIDTNNFNVNQPDLKDIFESRTEGGQKIVISLVAERDSSLRASAIKIHGTTCFGCNFNFKSKYGEIGEGFIEIHHVKPLSSFLNSKVVDPYTDLIPLCSNCHRIVHRKKDYVLSLIELKEIINNPN